MVFNPWIEKGRQIHRQSERIPTVTILTAAGPAAEVGAAAVPVAPLHVLHCLWLC